MFEAMPPVYLCSIRTKTDAPIGVTSMVFDSLQLASTQRKPFHLKYAEDMETKVGYWLTKFECLLFECLTKSPLN